MIKSVDSATDLRRLFGGISLAMNFLKGIYMRLQEITVLGRQRLRNCLLVYM